MTCQLRTWDEISRFEMKNGPTYLDPHLNSPDLRSKGIKPVRETPSGSKPNLLEKPRRTMALNAHSREISCKAVRVSEKVTFASEVHDGAILCQEGGAKGEDFDKAHLPEGARIVCLTGRAKIPKDPTPPHDQNWGATGGPQTELRYIKHRTTMDTQSREFRRDQSSLELLRSVELSLPGRRCIQKHQNNIEKITTAQAQGRYAPSAWRATDETKMKMTQLATCNW
ncbi:hypothetical protein EDB84DRAFT_1437156 [Lactarius hengduanensis]|nr:hypothetical protein EDB84DRAFT_1437156 [Lactarius hengduanensis]